MDDYFSFIDSNASAIFVALMSGLYSDCLSSNFNYLALSLFILFSC